jgi:hypothetical protein
MGIEECHQTRKLENQCIQKWGSFAVSHIISEGQFNEETGTIEVRSSGEGLSRTETAKTPITTDLRRVYQLKQGEEQDKYLHFIFDMATTTSPMQNHLEARLYKVFT